MNERIKELADKAIIHANNTWDPDTDANIFVAIAMEKHAKLIVQECLDMIYNNNIEDGDRALGAAADMISKRFGVEWRFGGE